MAEQQQAMTYREAYGILKQNAERLRKEQEIDIDELVPIVEQSSAAYRVVMERIEAVRKALAAHLQETEERQVTTESLRPV